MEKIKIAVVGAQGKMGSLICSRLQSCFDVVEISREDVLADYENLGLVIDFASGESSAISAKWCAKKGIPLIIGATGQTDEEMEIISKASLKTKILKAGNFSIGIYIVKQLIGEVLKNSVQDVVILEKHHKDKKDLPSGTALEIKAQIEKVKKVKSVLCLRGGKEIGSHEIDFYLDNELISINHQAFSRDAFVDGVELAVRFILKPRSIGLYDFADVFLNNF